MDKYPRCDERSVKIRRILCDEHQPVEQETEQAEDHDHAKHSQFLTYNRKDPVILCLRDVLQLLHAVAQPLSEEASRTDRIEPLHDLKASAVSSRLRVQPGKDPLKPEVITVRRCDREDQDQKDSRRGSNARYHGKDLRLRMDQEIQQAGDRHHDDRSTQIVRKEQDSTRRDRAQSYHPHRSLDRIRLLTQPAQFIRNEQDHRDLRDLRRLQCQVPRKLYPPSRPVEREPERSFYQRHHNEGKHKDLYRKCAIQMVIDL